MAGRDNQLSQIDSKLTALLALFLDGYLRETGIAKPKERSIDRILVDAGLSARTVAGSAWEDGAGRAPSAPA